MRSLTVAVTCVLTVPVESLGAAEVDGINELPRGLQLGEVQPAFAAFQQAYYELTTQRSSNQRSQKIKALEEEIANREEMGEKLAAQIELVKKEEAASIEHMNANKRLLEGGVISKSDYAAIEGKVRDQQGRLLDIERSSLQNKIDIGNLKDKLEVASREQADKSYSVELGLRKAVEGLKSEIASWEQKYILSSPVAGKVTFTKLWGDRQAVSENMEILAVVNANHKITGSAEIAGFGVSRVKDGQVVNILLDGYPPSEFGTLKGVVASVAKVARENSYLVMIDLVQDMNTTSNKNIVFRDGMQGEGHIITEDASLLSRLFRRIH